MNIPFVNGSARRRFLGELCSFGTSPVLGSAEEDIFDKVDADTCGRAATAIVLAR
jgi:hypothetical protein